MDHKKPFWERPFPQIYKCTRCGIYYVMRRPEPWAGCGRCVDWDDPDNHDAEGFFKISALGELEFILEGKEAISLIEILKEEGVELVG